MCQKLLTPAPEMSARHLFITQQSCSLHFKKQPYRHYLPTKGIQSSLLRFAARTHLRQIKKIQAQRGKAKRKSEFTPAGTDEHPLARDGVGYCTIVMDKGRVKGHAVHVEGHRGKLDAE